MIFIYEGKYHCTYACRRRALASCQKKWGKKIGYRQCVWRTICLPDSKSPVCRYEAQEYLAKFSVLSHVSPSSVTPCRPQMIANSAIGEMLQQSGITVRKNVRHSERVIYVDARKVRAYTLFRYPSLKCGNKTVRCMCQHGSIYL